MAKQQSYYMVIPAEVWESEITAKAMVLYGHIMVLTNKHKYCYAGNAYFSKVMKTSTSTIGRCMKELEEAGLISRTNIYKENSKEIKERRIYLNIGMVKNDNGPIVKNEDTPIVTVDQDNITSNNKTSNTNIDDVKGKVFFKLVERYPANRVGNRQHNLKKFKELSIEECKLSLLNLDRYLEAAQGYNKSLSNYIVERCFTEGWLLEQEKVNKTKKGSIIETKQFDNNYDNIT